MTTVPGLAKDLVGRGKSDGEFPSGALKGFQDMRDRSACADFSPR